MGNERLGAATRGFEPRPTQESVTSTENPQAVLATAVQEYRAQPHSPELITKIWQAWLATWGNSGKKFDLDLAVTACDRTQEEIDKLEREGRMLIFVPESVAEQRSRHFLGRIFRKIKSHSLSKKGSRIVTNENIHYGWLDIESSIDTPNAGTTEEDLRGKFTAEGGFGQNLTVYIIGSQFSKLINDHYFDEKKCMSRLLGSREEGKVVVAHFQSVNDQLHVYNDYEPTFTGPGLGGRSYKLKSV